VPLFAASQLPFTAQTIASDLRGGYQVVVADLNQDGKPDVIALASGMPELVWYENPTWARHVIARGLSRMINCVVLPAKAGARPEIVVASEFSNQAKDSVGLVSLLRPTDDPEQPWKAEEIDRLPTSHRLRLADFAGSGFPVVINAPLTGAKASAPDYRDQTPLVYYVPGEWQRHVISTDNSGIVHGIYVTDWDGDGRNDILTASFEGIHLFQFGKEGWKRTRIAAGDPAPWPKSGSSDVAVGTLGRKRRFLAAIEPWHGNQVAIYTEEKAAWARQVIDSALVDGHTIVTADLDGDGVDEVVAGYRGKGRSVYIYRAANKTGTKWTREILDDGGIPAAACAVADFDRDNHRDIVCIGGNLLKWYRGGAAGK
jgi:hypothetical protein